MLWINYDACIAFLVLESKVTEPNSRAHLPGSRALIVIGRET
jgi:hypothetical protein